MPKTVILLAEDHALVGQGLRALLEPEYVVIGPVQDGNQVPAAAADARPDVLLLDLSLPGRNGLDLIPEIRRLSPETRILIVTMHSDQVLVRSAFALGALGFILKDSDIAELRTAIAEVLAGRRYLSPRLPSYPTAGPSSPAGEAFWRLTPRQQQILKAIGEGRTTEEIADQLGLSVHTVYFHRQAVRRVLGIESDDGLVRYAALSGLGREGGAAEPGAIPPVPPTR